jgi:4-amino-4-deoxy-L-arabinose transferase-like glycosyltransferase
MNRFWRIFEIPAFFTVFALALWLSKPATENIYEFNGDDMRYIGYAVSMYEHGVYGYAEKNITTKAPSAGNANAPVYSTLIYGAMLLDKAFADSLRCIAEQGIKNQCPQNFKSLFIIQAIISVLCLYLIYVLALLYSGKKSLGWIAAVLALASGIFQEFSFMIMTEILILPAFCALLICCLQLYRHKQWRWATLIGLSLAFLTLTRPSYLYLFYAFILFFVILCLIKRDRDSFIKTGILIASFVIAILPWALRNKTHFDSYALTSGGYAETILTQRISYNQMSWEEVGVAMIYWLPDFGDSLAPQLFPEELYNKLSWDQDSYYKRYRKNKDDFAKMLGGEDKVVGYLIREEVLTPKHVAVSIPLAIRGIFIAKYWGLVGFIAALALGIQAFRRKDYSILLMAAPLLFMVAFHAGLSVSIPRYNLPLIALYALAMAWYINLYAGKALAKIRHK